MNRLFIVLALAGLTAASYAWWRPAMPRIAPEGITVDSGLPPCCQKSPTRAALLTGKPAPGR